MRKSRFSLGSLGLAVFLALRLCAAILPAGSVFAGNTVGMVIDPTAKTVTVGDAFAVDIIVTISAGEAVNTAEAHLNFNTTYLEVISITPGTALPNLQLNPYNNTAGTIDCTAGAQFGGVAPTTDFVLATLNLRAKAVTAATPLTFVYISPLRVTEAYVGAGVPVLDYDYVINGSVTINAAAISRLAFITTAQTITAGQASAVMTIQTQDAYDNPVNVATATTISLSSTSTSGKFYSDAAGSNLITSVTISSGTNSASFYYKDTTVGTPTITAAESPSQGWTDASQQETVSAGAVGAISKIVFSTVAQTLGAGQVSSVMAIQTQDAYGSPVNVTGATIISLSSTSAGGKFYSDAAGSNQISSVSISNGANSASFYYKDTTVGTPTITAAKSPSQGWTDASQQETVSAGAVGAISKIVFSTVAQTLGAGQVSSVMTTQTQNASGNPVSVTGATTINLASTSGNGKFYSDAAGSNQISSVTINSGTNSASFYYKDTTVGMPTITAAESPSQGWTDPNQAENVKAAAASMLVVSGITDPVEAGTACSVTVTAVDAYGNTDTTYAGTIHFTSSDAQAILPADYAFIVRDQGMHTFAGAVMLKTASEQWVKATDIITATITGQQTTITVTSASEALPSSSKAFPTYLIGVVLGVLVLVASPTVYFWRRRSAAVIIRHYRQQLDEWETEGYDVSELKKKWFE